MTLLLILFFSMVAYSIDHIKDRNIDKRSLTSKCYGEDIGCFSTDGWFFVGRPVNLLPAPRNVINTRFDLYTRKNKNLAQVISASNPDDITNSNFDGSKPTKFVIHGFLEHGAVKWIKDMAKQFLINGDFNAVGVDWGKGSGFPYTQAAANTRLVGRELALIITVLIKNHGLKPDNVHIIGHSLGAHIAGYAGEKLRQDGFPIARISGLDPAEPLFQNTAPFVHLDPTDANFVDIIHSDTRSILALGYGMSIPVGNIDVFPNGGKEQPGCDQSLVGHIVIEGLYGGARQSVACNHLRAIDYYIESINSECPFVSVECPNYEAFKSGECWNCGLNKKNCAEMGYHANKYTVGGRQYVNTYIDTAEKGPFCLYHYHVEVKLADNPESKDQNGKLHVVIYGNKMSLKKTILNSKAMTFRHGHTYKFLFTSPIDTGDMQRIEFSWQYFGSILDPSSWGLFRKPRLFIAYIIIRSISRQTTSLFCDGKGSAEQGVPRVLHSSRNCT